MDAWLFVAALAATLWLVILILPFRPWSVAERPVARAVILAWVMCIGLAPSLTAAGEDPEAAVALLHSRLKPDPREPSPDVHRGGLAELIAEMHDFPYIARVALGRHWRGLDPQQQARFIAAFARLSTATYAARLAPARFRITESSVDAGDRARVGAVLETGDREVQFEYQLRRVDGRWRIINILVDGVSDLALKRAEYDRLINERGFEGLLDELERQTAELEKRGP